MPPARLHIPGAHADVVPLPPHQHHPCADADPGEATVEDGHLEAISSAQNPRADPAEALVSLGLSGWGPRRGGAAL